MRSYALAVAPADALPLRRRVLPASLTYRPRPLGLSNPPAWARELARWRSQSASCDHHAIGHRPLRPRRDYLWRWCRLSHLNLLLRRRRNRRLLLRGSWFHPRGDLLCRNLSRRPRRAALLACGFACPLCRSVSLILRCRFRSRPRNLVGSWCTSIGWLNHNLLRQRPGGQHRSRQHQQQRSFAHGSLPAVQPYPAVMLF